MQGVGNRPAYSTLPIAIPVQAELGQPYSSNRLDLNKKKISGLVPVGDMAKAKTGSFYLTETIALEAAMASGARNQGTIDLGAYVNVPTGQAIAVESVDFIYQVGSDYGSGAASQMLAGNGGITVQLTDLNPGTNFVRADNHSLVASGCAK